MMIREERINSNDFTWSLSRPPHSIDSEIHYVCYMQLLDDHFVARDLIRFYRGWNLSPGFDNAAACN